MDSLFVFSPIGACDIIILSRDPDADPEVSLDLHASIVAFRLTISAGIGIPRRRVRETAHEQSINGPCDRLAVR